MCRWLAYSGAPLPLEDLIFKPSHSLIDQSLESRRSETTTNGDGFGVGWYGRNDIPGVYRSIQPAWNDENLKDLTSNIESRLFLAHIRRATGSAVQRSNCHPFRHGRWLFVHNGLIEGFSRIKRDLALAVEAELYPYILGTTDSEMMFYLSLSLGLDDDPIPALERMVGLVEAVAHAEGTDGAMQMSLGLSDGERLYAVRYATRGPARSLYHSKSIHALRILNPDFGYFSLDARAVVSEPLSDLDEYWEEIPAGTAIVVERGEISSHTFRPWPPA